MNGIGKRVTIGFMSIVALLFVSGMISLFELGDLSNDTENILSTSKRNMELAKEMLKSAHEHSRAMLHLAVFDEKEYSDLANRSMSDLEGCLAAARSESFNEACLDSLSVTVSKIRNMSEKFLGGGETEMQALKAEGQDSVVFSVADLGIADASVSGKIWYDAGYEPVYTELTEQIKHFMTLTYSSLAPRAAQLNKNAYRSVAPVLLSLLVMIAIVLMFFYFIMVYCVKPVMKMNKSLGGYLSYRMPYDVKAELLDEIKELNDNIESLINISKQNNKQ